MNPDTLARTLRDRGALVSAEWDAAVRAVPRHVFVPRFHEQRPDGTWRTVAEGDDGWLDAVYSDRPLVTGLRTDRRERPQVTSSSSAPGLMVRMLETLELRAGHRVLEIGTGTGYHAGLLAHRLDDGGVVSVDVEPDLVVDARRRLATLGHHPTLAAGDGADGLAEHAPYDRIVATCSVPRIPSAWIEQLAPGGRILADIKVAGAAGNLVDLRATPTGARGRFLPRWAGFMPLRRPGDDAPAERAEWREQAVERTTTASTRPWWDHQVVWFLAAPHLPAGVVTGVRMNDDREPVADTLHCDDGSWADVTIRPDDDGRRTVRGSTPDLWATVEDAYARWRRLGEPAWDEIVLTVTHAEQHLRAGEDLGVL